MNFETSDVTTMSGAVRRLAVLLAAIVLACMGPAVLEINLAVAPNWARVLLLGGGLLLAYLAWLMLVPCREALWAITWVFAIAAAGGTLTMAVVLFSPPNRPLPLELGDSRAFAAAWCALSASLLSAGSVRAGRLTVAESR